MDAAVEGPEIVHIGNDREQTNIADLARLVLDVVGVSATLQPMPPRTDQCDAGAPIWASCGG